MSFRIERDEDFIDDLQRWCSADASLRDEIVARIKAIEDDPFKGEWKPGGPIRGRRGESFRGGRFTIVYKLRPDDHVQRKPEQVETVYFQGITKHDNQARAGISSDTPIEAIYNFEIEVPASEGGQVKSGLYSMDHIHIDDESEDWSSGTMTLSGQYERSVRDGFNSVVEDEWIQQEERRPIEDFLPEP
jgi:Txe/YoeB family toxin of Txe-Axe toxin-antitoxin module